MDHSRLTPNTTASTPRLQEALNSLLIHLTIALVLELLLLAGLAIAIQCTLSWLTPLPGAPESALTFWQGFWNEGLDVFILLFQGTLGALPLALGLQLWSECEGNHTGLWVVLVFLSSAIGGLLTMSLFEEPLIAQLGAVGNVSLEALVLLGWLADLVLLWRWHRAHPEETYRASGWR